VEIFGIPEVESYWKWICTICVVEMLELMLGSMPEIMQRFKPGSNPVPYTSDYLPD